MNYLEKNRQKGDPILDNKYVVDYKMMSINGIGIADRIEKVLNK